MTFYNVHLYREIRLTFHRIEADTPEAAAAIARDGTISDADDIDDCDGEDFAARVDVIGDSDFTLSKTIEFEAERLRESARTLTPPVTKPAIAVVSIRGGLVEEVRSNHPLHVLVEDWDGTEVRPSHDPIVPEPMLPGEEADLTVFFQPATDQGD